MRMFVDCFALSSRTIVSALHLFYISLQYIAADSGSHAYN